MIDLTLSTGEPLTLKPARVRKFKGTRLPGCELYRSDRKGAYAIIFQEFNESFFSISYCSITAISFLKVQIREKKKGLRLVAVLTGELRVKFVNGREFNLLAGHYFIAEAYILQAEFTGGDECSFFTVYYTLSFLETIGLGAKIIREVPGFLPSAMKDTIDEMLINPYEQKYRTLYYDITISKLMLDHMVIPSAVPPGKLSDSDKAAVYRADRIIAENLSAHFTIRMLAKKANTNAYVLKKGFSDLLGISVFQRLIQRRMDTAKGLLEKTNKPIKDIYHQAGYQTLGGFITAFKKRFSITPKDWRKQQRKGT